MGKSKIPEDVKEFVIKTYFAEKNNTMKRISELTGVNLHRTTHIMNLYFSDKSKAENKLKDLEKKLETIYESKMN